MTALTLIRNETIKTTRRAAFWVTTLAFALIMTVMLLERQTGDQAPLGFPGIWSEMIGDVGPLAPFFAVILVILLVTSEFSFRTARQNVIDGLSKDAWFGGKLLLVPAITALFIGLLLAIGAVGGTRGVMEGAIVRGADLAVLGGYALGATMLVAGAFMAGILIRGSGAAMAAFFFYITLLESLIGLAIGRFSPEARPALRFLPFNTFTSLIDPAQFDPSIVATAAAQAAEAGKPFEAPTLMDPAALVAAGGAWILVFVAVAFLVFRRRDL